MLKLDIPNGASLADETSGKPGVTTMLKSGVFGGFNRGIAPGFQVFVAEHLGVVLEVGYARSWFKLGTNFLENTEVGQTTLRVGFVVVF